MGVRTLFITVFCCWLCSVGCFLYLCLKQLDKTEKRNAAETEIQIDMGNDNDNENDYNGDSENSEMDTGEGRTYNVDTATDENGDVTPKLEIANKVSDNSENNNIDLSDINGDDNKVRKVVDLINSYEEKEVRAEEGVFSNILLASQTEFTKFPTLHSSLPTLNSQPST